MRTEFLKGLYASIEAYSPYMGHVPWYENPLAVLMVLALVASIFINWK